MEGGRNLAQSASFDSKENWLNVIHDGQEMSLSAPSFGKLIDLATEAMTGEEKQDSIKGLTDMGFFKSISVLIHKANVEKGFWEEERNVGEMLMLVTSELSEALEAHRSGKLTPHYLDTRLHSQDDKEFAEGFKESVKDTFHDEIADAVIRLMDMAAGLGIDLDFHVAMKTRYNSTREKRHGKAY